MHPQELDLARRLALEADSASALRGPQGRTLVRPALRQGQPYDLLRLWFSPETLTLAPAGSGTAYASSAWLPLDTPLPLSQYMLIFSEPLSFDIDDAAQGGAFVSFVSLLLDDDSEAGLSGMQVLCNSSGAVSASGPVPDAVPGVAPGRAVKSVRVRLQADPPGTATASLCTGRVDILLFRSRLGRTIEYPRP